MQLRDRCIDYLEMQIQRTTATSRNAAAVDYERTFIHQYHQKYTIMRNTVWDLLISVPSMYIFHNKFSSLFT